MRLNLNNELKKYHKPIIDNLESIPSVKFAVISSHNMLKIKLRNNDIIEINGKEYPFNEDNIRLVCAILQCYPNITSRIFEVVFFMVNHDRNFIDSYDPQYDIFRFLSISKGEIQCTSEAMVSLLKHDNMFIDTGDLYIHDERIRPLGSTTGYIPTTGKTSSMHSLGPKGISGSKASSGHAVESYRFDILDVRSVERSKEAEIKQVELPDRPLDRIGERTKFFVNSVPCYRRFIRKGDQDPYWQYRIFEDDINGNVMNIPISKNDVSNHKKMLIEFIREIVNRDPVILQMSPDVLNKK
jgi:hypothetical protein